jgi:hypothetical protein
VKWLIIVLLLTGCASRPWTQQEKILLGVSCVAMLADTYTTTRFLDNSNNYEMNPILGSHPSDTNVVMYMFSSQVVAIILAHYFPKYRSWILGIKTGLNTSGAVNNSALDW